MAIESTTFFVVVASCSKIGQHYTVLHFISELLSVLYYCDDRHIGLFSYLYIIEFIDGM